MGIGTALPDDVETTFNILPVSGSPILEFFSLFGEAGTGMFEPSES